MDYRLALMSGIDIPIPDCSLILHQPTIKEIAYLGETVFFTGAQCLCINKSMYQGQIPEETQSFDLLMMLLQDKRTEDKRDAVQAVLNILFPNYNIFITPRAIAFNHPDGTFTLDEGNFESLQTVLKSVLCLGAAGQEAYNPANKKAQEIADKLMKARQKIAQQKGSSAGSVFAQYASILTVGLHSMSLESVLNLTMFQLYDLVERYMLYVNWDLDVKSKLAGGKSETKVDNWMKELH